MTRDDIQKLLGGYATGTLTPEEQQALFAAALDDQELFNALAKEQALRDLLRDPAARAQVLAAIDERPEPWWRRATGWVARPAAAGAMAACLAAVAGYAIWHARQMHTPPAPVLTAAVERAQVAPAQPALSTHAAQPPQARKPTPERSAVRAAERRPAAASSTPVAAPAPPPPVQEAPDYAANLSVRGSVNRPIPNQTPTDQASQSGAQAAAVQQEAISGRQQSVTVTAAAPVVQAPPQAPIPFAAAPPVQRDAAEIGGKFGAALLESRPEVKWSALRRERDGRLSPVEADQIRAGDVIVVRLEPYADGYLSVAENLPGSAAPRIVMARTRVERAKAVDTPAVTLDHPGVQELLVAFTPPPAASGSAGAVQPMHARQAAAAKSSLGSLQPAQTITLRYR
jgi:hypothetical protein